MSPPIEGEPPKAFVLDLYKLSVEMADRISARRGQANQFHLTLQSALLGVPAVFGALGGSGIDAFRASVIAVIGALTSVVWWLQLRSYRDLNAAKFKVINQIEADHLTIRPFTDEWVTLKEDPLPRWRGRYAELGSVERIVPIAFLLINFAIMVRVWL